MLNLKTNLFQLLVVFSLGVLISCGGGQEKTEDESEAFDAAKESLKENIEGVMVNLPDPTDLPYLLQATGADFNASLINSKDVADKYKSTFDKTALNLGIYAADIGYLSSYEQTQDALDYLQVAKQLSEHLGVVDAVDQVVMERFEENIDDRDSLNSIIDSAIDDVDQYLKSEERNKVAALVTTGSFIEGLYVSTELVRTYPKDLLPDDARNLILTPVIKIILDQESSVAELIKLIESLPEDDLTKQIKSDLVVLQNNYADLNMEDQIKNNRADLMLSDKTLEEITATVNKMRSEIIQ
ncbi:MAG: hypothetical protein ABFS32_02375 [Bacteroidota bacterium]